jgi:transposase
MTIGWSSDLKVVLVTGPIDFRAGVNKLASLVANELGRDPYGSDVFVFRSKRSDRLRLLHFDGSGMCMMSKWLEAGRFIWPPVQDGVIKLTSAQMVLLLGAMDWRRLEQTPVKKPELSG